MNIDDFIQNNLPKKKTSVFDEHIDDINKLIELNYSQKQVIKYLKAKCKNKTGLSEQNLSFYLRKLKDNNRKVLKKKEVKGKDSKTSLEQDMLDFVQGSKY